MKNFKWRFLILWLPLALLFVQGVSLAAQTRINPGEKSAGRRTTNSKLEKSEKAGVKSTGELSRQARYALVIGNGFYPSPDMRLPNTVNDTAIIAGSLRRIGFNVTELKNLTRAEMRDAIEKFSERLPADSVGLFFYAGHGLQVSGRNFLLPVDYKIVKTEADLLDNQLDLDGIVAAISKKCGLTIIILDTCRSNIIGLSLTFRSEQGFSRPQYNSNGIYIAYSTSPGMTAYDGIGNNSPYAKALAQNLLLSPGRLEDVFIKTRIEVRNETSNYPEGEQIPWETGSMGKLFYFTPDEIRNRTSIPSQKPVAEPGFVKPGLPFGITDLLKFSFAVPRLDIRGTRVGSEERHAAYFAEKPSLANLEMVEIPGGRYQMGSSSEEVERAYKDVLKSNDEADREAITAEMPQHSVDVRGFFMSKTEITQGQWRAVMGGLPEIPDQFRGDDQPVVNVTWKDANRFCNVLSGKTNRFYRLPTEAEWEYAARGGTKTPFAFGENINSAYVNFFASVPFGEGLKGEFRRRTVAAGGLGAPNNFGIYDMHGNVSEWCADYWHSDYNGAPNDGSAWNEPARQKDDDADDPALYRVIRGGSFESIGNNCRSAHRRARPNTDEDHYSDLGFRVVVSKTAN